MTRQIPPKGSRSRGPFIYVIRRSRPDGLVGVVCGRGRNPPMSFFKWEDVKILSPCCRHGGLCCRGDAVGSRAEPRWRRSINLPFADWIPQERFSSRPTSHYATHGRRGYPAHRILEGCLTLHSAPGRTGRWSDQDGAGATSCPIAQMKPHSSRAIVVQFLRHHHVSESECTQERSNLTNSFSKAVVPRCADCSITAERIVPITARVMT